MSDGQHWDWREHPGVTWAAGLSAAALLALLVVAVIQTSDSSHAPGFAPPPGVGTSSATAYTTSSTSVPNYRVPSYTLPSIQTSQDSGAPATTSRPSTAEPSVEEPTATTSTTASNPYGTTTPTNAGHV
ncbi:MAG: hypothetical protein M3O32_04995 [Actinomycetota bacterium]|nr:hypothetical protein [Actinomycetota bacterium]